MKLYFISDRHLLLFNTSSKPNIVHDVYYKFVRPLPLPYKKWVKLKDSGQYSYLIYRLNTKALDLLEEQFDVEYKNTPSSFVLDKNILTYKEFYRQCHYDQIDKYEVLNYILKHFAKPD